MAAPMLRQAIMPLLTGRVGWRAEYSCTAGVQAFIYGFHANRMMRRPAGWALGGS